MWKTATSDQVAEQQREHHVGGSHEMGTKNNPAPPSMEAPTAKQVNWQTAQVGGEVS